MSAGAQPDFIALMDQARSQVVELAKVLRSFHAALVACGFTEDQALALTLAFQTVTIQVSEGGPQ